MPEETVQKIQYCSVDLELTGFDPSQEEILEVGLAFFEVTENSLVITEKYSQVFKPRTEVHPKILGLTGIAQSELDEAPLFSEHRDELQNKLKDVVIVGHSVSVDIAFLRASGIECGDTYIDTLELAQFILPTHHSYNLENLMHSVGVTHVGAHRALADCLATLTVLERLLGVYQSFPKIVNEEIEKIISKIPFSWGFLLKLPFPQFVLEKPAYKDTKESLDLSNITPHTITSLDLDKRLGMPIEAKQRPILLALPHKNEVISYWEKGLVGGIFESKDYFSLDKFTNFLKREDLSYDEARFALKIIVWLYTNWQTQTILDLNLSFFGGQFKSFITSEERPSLPTDKIVACDHANLTELINNSNYNDRQIIVWDIGLFEQAISSRGGYKASWNFVLYLLKSIYNPETNFGSMEYKDKVVELLTATDLFFGIVSVLLENKLANNYLSWKDISNDDYLISRIVAAAENYTNKLNGFAVANQFTELASFSTNLNKFFIQDDSLVKWIEIREGYCAFYSQPLSINNLVSVYNDKKLKVSFLETTNNPNIISYYKTRFGFDDEWNHVANLNFTVKQRVQVRVSRENISFEDLTANLTTKVDLPVVVVFEDVPAIKDYYKQYYLKVKEVASVFAQGYSGGLNKLLRNFEIKKQSMLLATAQFLGQQHSAQIHPVTVIIKQLPHQSTEHPYLQAQLEAWKDHSSKIELSNIFDLILFHRLIERIYNQNLKTLEIYISPDQDLILPLAQEHLGLLGYFENKKNSNLIKH